MKKIMTVAMITLMSLPAGVLVFCGIIAIDLARMAAARARRTPYQRVKVTRADRREFEAALARHAVDIQLHGPRIIVGDRPIKETP